MSRCPAGAGIKAQVCSLVELLVTTLFQAYAVFYLPPGGGPRPGDGALSCGLLFSILENVTSSTPAGKVTLSTSGSNFDLLKGRGVFFHVSPHLLHLNPLSIISTSLLCHISSVQMCLLMNNILSLHHGL